MVEQESCFGCGGDRFIQNSAGNRATCPMCRGTGHKGTEVGLGLKDVTKTKERKSNQIFRAPKPEHPTTENGLMLEGLVLKSSLSDARKKDVIGQIIDFEQQRGRITETFATKTKKQLK